MRKLLIALPIVVAVMVVFSQPSYAASSGTYGGVTLTANSDGTATISTSFFSGGILFDWTYGPGPQIKLCGNCWGASFNPATTLTVGCHALRIDGGSYPDTWFCLNSDGSWYDTSHGVSYSPPLPTDTPTDTPTNTPVPTNTSVPTNTAVTGGVTRGGTCPPATPATPDAYGGFGPNIKCGVVQAMGDNSLQMYGAVAIPVALGVISALGIKALRGSTRV